MKYLRKIFESDNSSMWNEIEDILTPIKDDGGLSFKIQNFRYVPEDDNYLNPDKVHSTNGKWNGSRSSVLIKKDWDMLRSLFGPRDQEKRFYNIEDIKDELNHLCSRFPEVVNQIQIFRSRAQNPTRYTPQEFIKESLLVLSAMALASCAFILTKIRINLVYSKIIRIFTVRILSYPKPFNQNILRLYCD